jgi:hypothetical protein
MAVRGAASHTEGDNGSAFLGKPYEPNSVIKNDIEFILMQRKPGGYRTPDLPTRILSIISSQNYQGVPVGLRGERRAMGIQHRLGAPWRCSR